MTEKIIVNVKEGKVRGFKTKTAYSGAEYYTFLGVPYGQSTAGSARFKDPVKVKPWKTVFDATFQREGCRQYSLRKHEITGSEDCLYNNIYTPKLPSKEEPLKAVMVNIHLGGYVHGSPDPWYYGAPDYIMHKDVVYVCVGFRLYLLGNLNLHIKGCSGSQMLKDIILSLQWIKDNICFFGGDPHNITLMGSSSGAALVHLLLLSPLAKGLYHKAILMGMYNFNPVLVIPSDHVSTAYDLAVLLGYDGQLDNHKQLLNFFKSINYDRVLMIRRDQLVRNNVTMEVYPISPFVNSESGENSPLPESLEKLIPTTNRVPIMIGFCENEAAPAFMKHGAYKKAMSNGFYKVLQQNSCGWAAALSDDDLRLVQKEVEMFYLAGESIEHASQTALCEILTDITMSDVYGSLINIISENDLSPVYVYNFLFDGKLDGFKAKINARLQTEVKGTCHAADYTYWAYIDEFAGKTMANIRSKERQTIETLTSLFTNFAKTSNPNYKEMGVEWKPTTIEHPSHLVIDESLQVKDELLNGERMQFWHSLKDKFKR
ncbi:esterase FE4-like isoform X2 [Planococcus citri]|uniref:esterase FE4-like isoform X2 n=1 Tax=Planococcus citri TaxID=170843 RepID=UPI0031F848C9